MRSIKPIDTKNRKNHAQTHWILSLLLLLAVSLPGCGKEAVSEKREDPVKFVKLYTLQDAAALASSMQIPGIARASEEANLAFRVPGSLVKFLAKEGQEVEKGELLARLDPRDYETAVQQVSASLQGLRAQLKAMKAGARPEQMQQLKANIKVRQAQLDEVETRYERHQKLFNDEIISKQQLDAVNAEYNIALSQLEAAQEQLKEGERGARPEDVEAQQSQIRMLEAQLRDAKSKLSDTELRAPFDGVVAQTFVKNFEDIMPKQPILRMQALSQIEIEVNIPEADMAQVGASGLSLHELFDSFVHDANASFSTYPGRKFSLDLKAYETIPDPATQTYRISMVMEQPEDITISPGMNATVTGHIDVSGLNLGTGSSLLIPGAAVFADPSGGSNVWLVNPENQRIALRTVTLGDWQNDSIEVLEGLNIGDTIAVSAVQMLQTGMQVEQMQDMGEL